MISAQPLQSEPIEGYNEVLRQSNKHYSPGFKGFKERVWRTKILHKRVPCTLWLPNYNKDDAIGDLIAGVSIGLMLIPQMLAFSGLAGLDAQYGLYSAFFGMFVYVFIGSSKDVILSPTATSSLMVFITAGGSWQRAVLLTFITGLVQLLAAILRLGFIIDFISGPVGAGFTSALALTVVISQMKSILGIKATGSTFVEIFTSLIQNIGDTKLGDVLLGVTCIVVLIFLRWIGRLKLKSTKKLANSVSTKTINKFLWLLGLSRNALIVLITGLISYSIYKENVYYFAINGPIPKGLPSFSWPTFSIDRILNETTGEIIQEGESFWEMINYIGTGIVVVPLVGLLENMNAVKTFAQGKRIDATQELIALGLGNICNSFVQGYNSCGGLTKASVVNSSGVRTQLASLYAAGLVIFALLFLAPGIFYIPKATLAAVVISAIIFVIQHDKVMHIWRTKRIDLIPAFSTFFACLVFRIDIGILIGIGVNIIFILHNVARPKIYVLHRSTQYLTPYLLLIPDRCIYFPSVDYVKGLINKQSKLSKISVVLDCNHIFSIDYTGMETIKTLMKEFEARGQPLLLYRPQLEVETVLDAGGVNSNCYRSLVEVENKIDDFGGKRTSL